jgi:hypothetical protein
MIDQQNEESELDVNSLAQNMIVSIDEYSEELLRRTAEEMARVREELIQNEFRIAACDNEHKRLNGMVHDAHQELEKYAAEARAKMQQIKPYKKFNFQVGVSTENCPSMQFIGSLQHDRKLTLLGYVPEQMREGMNRSNLNSERKKTILPPTSNSEFKPRR